VEAWKTDASLEGVDERVLARLIEWSKQHTLRDTHESLFHYHERVMRRAIEREKEERAARKILPFYKPFKPVEPLEQPIEREQWGMTVAQERAHPKQTKLNRNKEKYQRD